VKATRRILNQNQRFEKTFFYDLRSTELHSIQSSTGMKHAKPLSEDEEQTAEALIEKLKARQQPEQKR
jgi:transcriptional regulator of NAD metabolism